MTIQTPNLPSSIDLSSLSLLSVGARAPLVVSYGLGVDSTAMLVAMQSRGIRPDLILFADTGSEKPSTYAYIATMNAWLASVGFPAITIVKNPRPRSGDTSLAEACHRTCVLPALAFNQHQCSLVWKVDPQDRYVRRHYGWSGKTKSWATVPYVIKAIGYDAGPRDRCRAGKSHGKDSPGFRNWYPLIEWDIDRERCEEIIRSAGLPVPEKSSCFMCPAMRKDEIVALGRTAPDQLRYAIEIEDRAIARGLTKIKGLGRSWSWRSFIETEAPEDVAEILRPATPVTDLYAEDNNGCANVTADNSAQFQLFAAA